MSRQLRPLSTLRRPGRYSEVEDGSELEPIFLHKDVPFVPELAKSCAFPSLPLDDTRRHPNDAFADLHRAARRMMEQPPEPALQTAQLPPSGPSASSGSDTSGDSDEDGNVRERSGRVEVKTQAGRSQADREAFVACFFDRAKQQIEEEYAIWERNPGGSGDDLAATGNQRRATVVSLRRRAGATPNTSSGSKSTSTSTVQDCVNDSSGGSKTTITGPIRDGLSVSNAVALPDNEGADYLSPMDWRDGSPVRPFTRRAP